MKQLHLSMLSCLIFAASASGKGVPFNVAANLVIGQTDFVSSAPPTAPSSFSLSGPEAVAIDPITGKVFVADRASRRILRYPNAASLSNGAGAEAVFGQPRFSTSATGVNPGFSGELRGLFFDRRGRLWVADRDNNRVVMFEAASYRETNAFPDRVYGQADFTTNSSGLTASKMFGPQGVWVDDTDRLWVADYYNNRVLRFDSISTKVNGSAADGVLGQANFTTGSAGSGSSGLQGPVGVTLTSAGTLFVGTDTRVMRFDKAATLGNGAGANVVLGQPDFATLSSGLSSTKTNLPWGAWVASDDTLWVSDYSNSRVLRFDKASTKSSGAAADGVVGQPDFVTNSTGTTRQKLGGPIRYFSFVDTSGNLWVSDSSNNRVLRFPVDATRPLLAVTTPIPKTTSLEKFTIKGTASDSSGITKVFYKVNNGAIKTAIGTTTWQFKVSLASGKNTITIATTDGAYNQSLSKVIKIKRISGAAPLMLAAGE